MPFLVDVFLIRVNVILKLEIITLRGDEWDLLAAHHFNSHEFRNKAE